MCFTRSMSINNSHTSINGPRYRVVSEFFIAFFASVIMMYLGFKNYLLFHITVEIFSSLIGFGTLLIALNTYRHSKNNFFMILGIAYGFVGSLDILHALTYKGMGIFDSSLPLVDIATQLWIAARYVEVFSLLAVCVVARKSIKGLTPAKTVGIYTVIFSIVILSIFNWMIFPSCFLEGVGLTSFKIFSEYMICIILILSINELIDSRERLDYQTFYFMIFSLISTVLSELSFTLYNEPYGFFNMTGHILKAISFYFIYKAIIEIGLRNPYKLLFNELKETNESLEKKSVELNDVSYRLRVENQQRLQMEQIIVENEECYNLLVRSTKEAILVSIRGKIIFANEGLMRLLGVRTIDKLIGRNVIDIVPESEKDRINKIMEERYSKSKLSGCYESKILKDTGDIIDIEVKDTYFSYKGLSAILIVIRDITKNKEVQKLKNEFEESRKKLHETMESNKLITEFFADISHELKTPLNVILGSVQVLNLYTKEDMPMYSMQNKYLKIMKQNCYRLLRLVNNLIDISKIDSGFLKLQLSNYNIVNIVEDITLSVADYAENKGVSLIFDTDVEEKFMACDPDKIERIILNLLSNAIKFTNDGDEILVYIKDKGNSIVISVKDTGIGIPEDKLQLIFQRFRQVDKHVKMNKEGSGIGLSLVKSLVEMHGGNISINSKVGEGSEFIIELPIRLIEVEETTPQSVVHEGKVERIDIEFSDIYS